MSLTNKQKRRALRNRLWSENPKCFFCGMETVNEPAIPHVPDKPNRAVLFHLHSRLDGFRGRFPGKLGSVLCCRKCAGEQAAKENAQLPIEELHARSGRYPQPMNTEIQQATTLLQRGPEWRGPAPIKAYLSLESTKAGPALMGMIGALLRQAGATIEVEDERVTIPDFKVNLEGMTVTLGRIIWTVDKEEKLRRANELADLLSAPDDPNTPIPSKTLTET